MTEHVRQGLDRPRRGAKGPAEAHLDVQGGFGLLRLGPFHPSPGTGLRPPGAEELLGRSVDVLPIGGLKLKHRAAAAEAMLQEWAYIRPWTSKPSADTPTKASRTATITTEPTAHSR